jgi:hypothetical protein
VTEQAQMKLDFVNVNEIKNISRLERGIAVSSTRHIQGTFEFIDSNGTKYTDNVGIVEIR